MALNILRGEAMTFTDLARKRLMALSGSDRTGQNYNEAYALFVEYLHSAGLNDDVREFTPANVENFKTWYLQRPRVRKTSALNNRLAALASLGQWGIKNPKATGKPGHRFYLADDPMIHVERPKKKKPVERWLYRNEIRAILNVDAPMNERLALALLFHTQLRATAASSAKVRDLSLDGDQVKLSVIEKGDKPDTFDLPPEIAEPLMAHLREREAGPDETILVTSAGRPFGRSGLSELVARLAVKAGVTRVPVRCHLFARHSAASIAGQDGASVFEIAAMLRHSDTSTARKYVHGVSGDAARARVRALVLEETR